LTYGPSYEAFRATIAQALKNPEFELSGGAAFVWIVGGDGNLTLPADQVKARLDHDGAVRPLAA
jgi:hypothetical protein